MNKLQKGDEVKVIVGKYKGKTSKVTQVLPNLKKVVVEKVNVVKRHMKPSHKAEWSLRLRNLWIGRSHVGFYSLQKPSRIQMAIVNGVRAKV